MSLQNFRLFRISIMCTKISIYVHKGEDELSRFSASFNRFFSSFLKEKLLLLGILHNFRETYRLSQFYRYIETNIESKFWNSWKSRKFLRYVFRFNGVINLVMNSFVIFHFFIKIVVIDIILSKLLKDHFTKSISITLWNMFVVFYKIFWIFDPDDCSNFEENFFCQPKNFFTLRNINLQKKPVNNFISHPPLPLIHISMQIQLVQKNKKQKASIPLDILTVLPRRQKKRRETYIPVVPAR